MGKGGKAAGKSGSGRKGRGGAVGSQRTSGAGEKSANQHAKEAQLQRQQRANAPGVAKTVAPPKAAKPKSRALAISATKPPKAKKGKASTPNTGSTRRGKSPKKPPSARR